MRTYKVQKLCIHSLWIAYGTVSESGTGPLDDEARCPVPDPESRLWGMSRGPVVCETTTDKSRDTGMRVCTYTYM